MTTSLSEVQQVRSADRRLRVLHVIPGLDAHIGGPAAALAGLAQAQQRLGMDVRVLTTSWHGCDFAPIERLRTQGISVGAVGPAPRSRELRSAADSGVIDIDIVHIHGLWEEVQHQAAVAARRAGVPYIFRPCGMLDPWSLNQKYWKKRLYLNWRLRRDLNRAAAIHYTADLERDLASPLKLRPPSIVEPNGVDLKEFQTLPVCGTFRSRYDIDAACPLVLFLGRLHPKKGIELLLSAFAEAAPAPAILAIVGPGEQAYRERLEQLAVEAMIRERVSFVGMLRGADRVAALADADLFVLPSYQENFGIAVVEALAAGTPVVISDQVNIYREIAAAGVGGVVQTSVEPLAAELRRWLTDEPLRQRSAERARAFVWDHYDWDAIARQWVQHYTLLAKPRPSSIARKSAAPMRG